MTPCTDFQPQQRWDGSNDYGRRRHTGCDFVIVSLLVLPYFCFPLLPTCARWEIVWTSLCTVYAMGPFHFSSANARSPTCRLTHLPTSFFNPQPANALHISETEFVTHSDLPKLHNHQSVAVEMECVFFCEDNVQINKRLSLLDR